MVNIFSEEIVKKVSSFEECDESFKEKDIEKWK